MSVYMVHACTRTDLHAHACMGWTDGVPPASPPHRSPNRLPALDINNACVHVVGEMYSRSRYTCEPGLCNLRSGGWSANLNNKRAMKKHFAQTCKHWSRVPLSINYWLGASRAGVAKGSGEEAVWLRCFGYTHQGFLEAMGQARLRSPVNEGAR